MKEWFESLEARERRIMLGGGVVLLLMLVYFLGWEPFINRLHGLRESTQQKELDVTWMRNAAQQVKQLQARSEAPAHLGSGQSLLGVIDRTAKLKKLNDSVKRVQPDGSNKARVSLESANFDIVIAWLEELERHYGVGIETITFDKREEPGLVDARVSFIAAAE